jgi:hypothetical protein
MSERTRYDARPGRRGAIDARRLWVGGVMSGLVAAGVALVGLMAARGLLDIQVLVRQDGALVNANSWWYASVAFIGALAATALMHLLLASAPRPRTFFSWIVGLATVLAMLAPLATDADLESKIATAVINLAIGIAIASLVGSVGDAAAAAGYSTYRPREG